MGVRDSGTDETLAAPSTDQSTGSTLSDVRAPVVVRTGEQRDFVELPAIDPKNYLVGAEIARGGMGRIVTARDRRLGRPVAIKELLDDTPAHRARFEREARITARLQHPAIVNLYEAGQWPNGEPFYVMKLVEGQPLGRVIANQTFEQRLGLLSNVSAVVDALAYAHGKGVIHRDLKPSNILVGEFGETVVIDWGLAKNLRDSDPIGDAVTRWSSGDETVAGAVMGTPIYMPPEQARGDTVDERADVYALGAILYHVLTGHAPYTGSSSADILEQVSKRPPPLVAELEPRVPPDLVTIVHKALARDAADRYANAKELADDLKRFQTGQLVGSHRYTTGQLVRRWLRRHRTAVAVASIAAVLLIVVGIASITRIVSAERRAEAQRTVAVEARGEAEELLRFMMGDLKTKLRALGRLDLLDDVATKAMAYYDHRGDTLSTPERAKLAIARRNLGDVLLPNKVDEALRLYRDALVVTGELAREDPANVDYQIELAETHDAVGEAVAKKGDAAAALAEYRAASSIRERLAANDPSNDERQGEVSLSKKRIGGVLRKQGDAKGALAEFQAALAIDEKLAARSPTSDERQRDVSVAQLLVGDLMLARGDADAAITALRSALVIREALAAKKPTDVQRQNDLMVNHQRIGDALVARGDTPGALAAYRASFAIAQSLAANDPTNGDRQRQVEVNHNKIGELLAESGDTTGALAEYRSALAIAEKLAATDRASSDRKQDLSSAHANVADILRRRGDKVAALAAYREAFTIDAALAASDPTNASWQRNLSISHNRIGDQRRDEGDLAGALVEYRASLAIRERLATKDPTNADRQHDLAMVHERIGKAVLPDDPKAALESFRASLAIAQTIAAKDPSNASRQRKLVLSYQKVGEATLALNDAEGAVRAYEAAHEIVEKLVAKDPGNTDRQQDLSAVLEGLGKALLAHGKIDAALVAARGSFAITEKLAAKDPENADEQHNLASSHASLGDVLAKSGANARTEYEAALAILQRLRTKSPPDAQLAKAIDGLLVKLGRK